MEVKMVTVDVEIGVLLPKQNDDDGVEYHC